MKLRTPYSIYYPSMPYSVRVCRKSNMRGRPWRSCWIAFTPFAFFHSDQLFWSNSSLWPLSRSVQSVSTLKLVQSLSAPTFLGVLSFPILSTILYPAWSIWLVAYYSRIYTEPADINAHFPVLVCFGRILILLTHNGTAIYSGGGASDSQAFLPKMLSIARRFRS